MNEGPESIDYKETSDVTEVHSAIQREHRDPVAEVTPVPLWLTILSAASLCWAGAYLGVFHGGFSGSIYNEYQSSPTALFPLPASKEAKKDQAQGGVSLAQLGKSVYAQCQPCHQASGLGVPGQFPPLVNAEYVKGGEKRLLAILLKGLQGPLTVLGKPYNNNMPAWEASLTNKKIAAVASYIRSEWGNSAPEISEEKVAAARKEFADKTTPYSEAELLTIPEDAGYGSVAVSAPAAASGVQSPAPVAGGQSGKAPAAKDSLAAGEQVYKTVCVACHQPNGLGLPNVFPPIAKTEYVIGDPKRFAAMVLKGVVGPITVDGKLYTNMMPGQEALLTDEKIAAVLTYVRASFGNQAPAVSAELVKSARAEFAERKTPWTEAELKAFPSDAAAVEKK
jgi:mono/diheme cytochrome c family protein